MTRLAVALLIYSRIILLILLLTRLTAGAEAESEQVQLYSQLRLHYAGEFVVTWSLSWQGKAGKNSILFSYSHSVLHARVRSTSTTASSEWGGGGCGSRYGRLLRLLRRQETSSLTVHIVHLDDTGDDISLSLSFLLLLLLPISHGLKVPPLAWRVSSWWCVDTTDAISYHR